jgi:PAS fold.
MDNMKRHLLGESPAYEVEHRIQTKEGNYIWFYDRGTIVQYDDDGKSALIAGIVFAITKK